MFNLPSWRTLSNFDTLDGQAKEGVLHETLRQMENEINQRIQNVDVINNSHEVWLRSGILKFDEMKVEEKLGFNPHTMELIGFICSDIDNNVISNEFKKLGQ